VRRVEKRARIIKAEGEMEAAAKLNEAAQIMSRNSVALELRRVQTLTEIGAEHNSVIIVAKPTQSNTTGMTAGLARAVAQTRLAQAPQAGAPTE
jgi:hypothetical protein